MALYSKTIHIACKNLGGTKSATLLLTFDDQPNMKGTMYTDYCPVVWRVTEFHPEGSYGLRAIYKNQLVFINPQSENLMSSSASTWTNINTGQKTELTEKPGSVTNCFTPPSKGEENTIEAINKTQTVQTIGVGFDNGGSPPPTLLVFKKVGATQSATVNFTPVVRAYISSDYKEESILTEPIRNPCIWQQNLAALESTTYWNLKHDSASGTYSIIPGIPPITL